MHSDALSALEVTVIAAVTEPEPRLAIDFTESSIAAIARKVKCLKSIISIYAQQIINTPSLVGCMWLAAEGRTAGVGSDPGDAGDDWSAGSSDALVEAGQIEENV